MSLYKPLPKSAKKRPDPEGKLRRLVKPLDPVFAPFVRIYNVLAPIPVIGPIVRLIVRVFAVTGIAGLIVAAIAIIMVSAVLAGVALSECAPNTAM